MYTHPHSSSYFFFVLRNLILMVDTMDYSTDAMMVEITGKHYYHYHDSSLDRLNDGFLDSCINTCNYI